MNPASVTGEFAETAPSQHGALVHTRRERELAAAQWLSSAAADTGRARHEWAAHGVALLQCGSLFAAVRIPAGIVHAAVGTDAPEAVASSLAVALGGGPVFLDSQSRHFYVLAPASLAHGWNLPDTECLGAGVFLGVPATDRTEPDPSGSYWVVPMDGPGTLCEAGDVQCLVAIGQFLAAKAEKEAPGHE